MGNQITAIAPAQILPLESYFNDLADYGKPNRSVPMAVQVYVIYSDVLPYLFQPWKHQVFQGS